jgi:glyoxylase-like metal-dependent hydrolase (beta-lactamase superfamily II)
MQMIHSPIRQPLRGLCVLFLLCFAGISSSASVQKIGPDLYAYISENDSSSNSTFLVSEQGILVVDTGLNAQEGRKLLDEIRKFSSAPVRWIVNTHYHPDHRGGNSTVGPDAIIISTEQTRKAVLRSPSHTGAARGYQLNEVFLTASGPTFFVGGHEVRIYYPGPAHTMGDAVVYFPDQHAIATGDLFLNNSCPAIDQGDLENWITALEHMFELPIDQVVPGHFELATKSELQNFHNYLADLRDQVRRMYEQGKSLAQIQKRLDLSAYKGLRQFPQYEATFKDNAAVYYKQLEKKKCRARHIS